MNHSLNFSSLLVTELWTPLYKSSAWKTPIFPAEVTNLYHSERMLCVDKLIEPELSLVFKIIQNTTILVNKHYYQKTSIDGIFIRQCLGFIHSNLIETESCLTNALSECLRLGMMAFLATTFRLQGSYDQHYCEGLTKKLQLSYRITKATTSDLPETIDIWLALVLLISTDDVGDLHASLTWNATHGLSWNEIRIHLKRVMWIDSFHDDLGRRAIETLMSRIKSRGVFHPEMVK